MTLKPKFHFPTTNQKWARERNFSKFMVKGIQSNARSLLNSKVLTEMELDEAMDILSSTKRILLKWDEKNPISKDNYKKESKK